MKRSADIVRSDLPKSSKSRRNQHFLPFCRTDDQLELLNCRGRKLDFCSNDPLSSQQLRRKKKETGRVLLKYLLYFQSDGQFCYIFLIFCHTEIINLGILWRICCISLVGSVGETIIKKWQERANALVLAQFQT